jgi:hypothetical protein
VKTLKTRLPATPLRRFAAVAATLAAVLLPLSLTTAQASAAPLPATQTSVVVPHGGNGYVTEGNLRSDPSITPTNIIDTIYNQWVDFTCYIDAGNNGFGSTRWFYANYYGKSGYVSSGVVSPQPSVPHCR